MSRRAHLPAPLEVVRLLAEHAATVGFLFLGLVAGAFLRDPHLPPASALEAWFAPGALADHLGGFWQRLARFRPHLGSYLAWNVFSAAVLQHAMYLHGLYDRQPVRRARNRLLRLLRSAVVAAIALSVVFFLVRPPELGRTALLIGYGLTIACIWTTRTLRHRLLPQRAERLLILGEGPGAAQAVAAAAQAPPPGFDLAGRVGGPEPSGADEVARPTGSLPRLGGWGDLGAVLALASVDRLLVASEPPPEWDLEPLVAARLGGVAVDSAREFAEGLTGQVLEEGLGVDFITAGTARAYGRVSRLADVVLAAFGLLALLPLLLALAAIVRATSGSPVLFRQERVGQGGGRYTCYKFRTMRADAEAAGPRWSPRGDPRVTPAGRFLRRWRLDELPQLWNVLRGDMAFVGPRPEQPYFVERLNRELPNHYLRHVVRPGLTGWAQVRHAYASTDEDARTKLRHDLFYIKHRSPYLDLAILFDTVRVVLSGRGR